MKTTINIFLSVLIFTCLFNCKNEKGAQTEESVVANQQTTEKQGQAFINDDEATPNCLQIAIGSPDHKTLVAAVQAAQVENALVNVGPLTVFAPTDAAFAALGTVVDDLLLDPTGALADILLYHVVSGTVLSTDLTAGDVPTLNGKSVTVSFDGGNAFINGAQVTVADIETDNGVVHVIDAVLLPPAPQPTTTVVDVIVNSDVHNTLEAAVYGKPVIFGPHFKKFAEATELIENKGAFSIQNFEELNRITRKLLDNEEPQLNHLIC